MPESAHLDPPAARHSRIDQLRGWLRQYAQERINSRLIDERRCVPPYIVLDFGNQGLFGLQVPSSYGGLGLGYAECTQVLEQLAAIDLTLATLVFLHNSNGIRPIQNFARPALRDELLPRLAQGRELTAFALSEPAAGSNIAALRSFAEPLSNSEWCLRGVKRWNASAWAGVVNVFVRTQSAHGKLGGLTGFVVRQGTKGLRLGPESLTMGVRGIMQNALYLEDVRVSDKELLGEPDQAIAVIDDALGIGRLYTASVALGAMKRSAQWLFRYASRRHVSTGKLLGSPIVRARLTEIVMMIRAAEALIRMLVTRLDERQNTSTDLLMLVKVLVTRHLNCTLDDLLQLLGGRGYMEENLVPQWYRDGKLLSVGEGPNESLLLHLGRAALYKPELVSFCEQICGAADVAERLRETIKAVHAARRQHGGQAEDGATWQVWSDYQLGEAVVEAVQLATLLGAAHPSGSNEMSLVVAWARLRFEAAVANVCNEGALQKLLSEQQIALAVTHYKDVIGDVEQRAAGVEQTVDTLLRQGPASLNEQVDVRFPGDVEPPSVK